MIDIDKNYKKEMQFYDKKIGTKENFNKVIEEIKKVGKFKVKLDDFYTDENKILGLTHFYSNSADITFCFHNFYGIDGKADISNYLKGINYTLDLWIAYDNISFEELEAAYKDIKIIKKIIDKIIGVDKNDK